MSSYLHLNFSTDFFCIDICLICFQNFSSFYVREGSVALYSTYRTYVPYSSIAFSPYRILNPDTDTVVILFLEAHRYRSLLV